MKPYITCFMYASLDGHIDCAMTEKIDSEAKAYYEVLEGFGNITNINGRVTRYTHNALPQPFKSYTDKKAEKGFYKACDADSYEVSLDTNGSLMWGSGSIDGKPMICILSENASDEYTGYLKGKGISYIVTGKGRINLTEAMDILYKEFGVKRALLTGGGHINSSFMDEGLLKELWMMYGPGIDGRKGYACAFDGRSEDCVPVVLKLNSVEKLVNDTVLLKYNF